MDDYVDAPPAPQDPHPSKNGEQMENGGGGELPSSSLGFVPRDGVPGYGRDDEEGAVGGGRGDESMICGSQSAEGGNNLYLRPAFFGNLAHITKHGGKRVWQSFFKNIQRLLEWG